MHAELKAWESGGSYVELPPFGHRLFCMDVGDAAASPDDTLLLLHGFPESSFSFHKVLDGLRQRFARVVLFDMVGYGLSDKPTRDYGYSLFEQADAALAVWQHLGVRGGHLLGHDMGDSVATELVARHVNGTLPGGFSEGFKSFTFTNGSMVLEHADFRIMQKLLLTRWGPMFSRLSNFHTFRQQVTSAQGTDALQAKDIELLWENCRLQDGHRMNHLLIKYLFDRRRFEKTRWLPSLAKVKKPIHLCWGEADAVARVAMAHHLKEKVCPQAMMTLMPGVGHFCQLSDPEDWLKGVLGFY